ncbi:L-2-hydroxyglutarate oxidase [Dyadobacter sandarakinus]|uniref:L-2-hydroxyglutarate oxidase n=1 Tax=Dyadobacter sandarakinus TaxID=2747268 RepID=A0ABX7IA96_9BACT|nr:L-2-hydroxyglutarate oxidase [Dyadobacter sandarakinus]QRR03024.1 L-2-hydroxyglutarate oxidase [Dyadobacter sandarakinus]
MYDITIIGSGIVGLATALRLIEQRPSLKIAVLEKEQTVAMHQTGHNSGVIHSGLYYKPGSLKATNCIRGYQMLIDFCRREEVPFDLCGKIVVATNEAQRPLLRNLYERGVQNGLTDNRMINAGEIREIEPHVKGLEGIWVPYTGIIDYKSVSDQYAECFRKAGGEILFGQKVTGIRNQGRYPEVIAESGKVFETRLVVNCAGLYSDKIAQMTQPEPVKVRIIPFRGEYYKLTADKHHLVRNLIYPVPDPNFPFLGVHFTRMIEGGIEAGPNAVFAFRREGYRKTDIHMPEMLESLAWPGFRKVAAKYWRTGMGEYYRSFSKAAFTKALQGLIPEIQMNDLVPGGAGVRAQACDYEGGLLDDFAIIENKVAINVCNAPSPAATSSLSIGQTISEKVLARF